MDRFAKENTPIGDIAADLNVKTVLQGSVQFANRQIRVNVNLVDPITNQNLWSENYDREFSNIFEIQADIAKKIADALQTKLSPAELVSIEKPISDSSEAYALYMHAMDLADWDLSPDDSNDTFHQLLDQAIALDPSFARAYATKAFAHAFHRDQHELAIENAQIAQTLDPNLGLSHAAMAIVQDRIANRDAARTSFQTAYRLSPKELDVLDNIARFSSAVGNQGAALSYARQMKSLDPARAYFLGLLYWILGDLDEALVQHYEALTYVPDNHDIRIRTAILEKLTGNNEESGVQAGIARSFRNADSMGIGALAHSAHAFHAIGLQDDADVLVNEFEVRRTTNSDAHIAAETLARAYIGSGDYDAALEQLKVIAQNVEDGQPPIYFTSIWIINNLYQDPELEKPEFVAVRKRLDFARLDE